jgi:hypothetical protein
VKLEYMNLTLEDGDYSIYKFSSKYVLPEEVYLSDFYSITVTGDETSVVTRQKALIKGYEQCNKDWKLIKVEGPLDFTLVGIIADLSAILKINNISIFTLSTYNTDYILVKQNDLDSAINALRENGHNVVV